MVTLYKISDGSCGQATLEKTYEKYAEAFAGLTEGTCPDNGYTEEDGTQSLSVPVLGSITVSLYKKAAILEVAASGCKTVTGMESFDIDTYINGKWYIQQQMETEYLPKEQNYCVSAEYSMRSNVGLYGYTIAVHNVAYEEDGTVHDSKDLLCAKADSSGIASQLEVAPCFLPPLFAGPYWVVDYSESDGYALVSGGQPTVDTGNGCKTGTGVNDAGLWIFTRKQQRDDALVQKVRSVAISQGFDVSVLNDVDQSNC